jgi:hypothetical protein
VFQCNKKQIIILCETAKNKDIRDAIQDMLFVGRAHSHVDLESFQTSDKNKAIRWAMLELERRVLNGESVVITGNFANWYELVPIAVIASMSGFDLVIGKTVGQRLAVGDIVDINVVLDHFMSKRKFLHQFYSDPFSAIDVLKDTDRAINSLVIFPSILREFFSR